MEHYFAYIVAPLLSLALSLSGFVLGALNSLPEPFGVPTETSDVTPSTLPTAPVVEEEVVILSQPPPLVSSVPKVIEEEEAPPYDEVFVSDLEEEVHRRINIERLKAGLKTLAYDEELAAVAALHSTDMAKENYFAHEDEDGCDSACRLDDAGYKWRYAGENIFLIKSNFRYILSDAAAVIVAGWMGSDGHRKNILQKVFTQEGIGVVISGESIYITELLTKPR